MKIFWWGYNFSLNLTLIGGLHKKLWAFKIIGFPISRILKLPTWESWDKMTFGCSLMVNHKEYYKGEATKFGPWWVLRVRVCLWFVHDQKCSNYALTNLLFSFCKSVWMVDLIVTHSTPHPKALACPYYPFEMLRVKEHPSTLFSPLFSFLNTHLSLLKSLGVC